MLVDCAKPRPSPAARQRSGGKESSMKEPGRAVALRWWSYISTICTLAMAITRKKVLPCSRLISAKGPARRKLPNFRHIGKGQRRSTDLFYKNYCRSSQQRPRSCQMPEGCSVIMAGSYGAFSLSRGHQTPEVGEVVHLETKFTFQKYSWYSLRRRSGHGGVVDIFAALCW